MAGKYAPKGRDNLIDLVEMISRQIVDIYAGIEKDLAKKIAQAILKDQNRVVDDLTYRMGVINELERDVRNLLRTRVPANLAEQIISLATTRGTAYGLSMAGLYPGREIPNVTLLTKTAISRATLIAADLNNAFSAMHLRILRYPRDAVGNYIGTDVYQQVVAGVTSKASITPHTLEQLRKAALQEFLNKGVTSFTDISGRRWTIGSYASMATRTATQRSYTEASIYSQQQAGINLVGVLNNRDSCQWCAAWAGKLLSTDGTPAGTYTMQHSFEERNVQVTVDATFDEARSQGLGHPNCCCTFPGYVPGWDVPAGEPYDPEREGDREEQRRLERKKRALEVKQAVAEGIGNNAEARKLKDKIKSVSKELKELTTESGQYRQYAREHKEWDTGRGAGSFQNGTPPSASKSSTTSVTAPIIPVEPKLPLSPKPPITPNYEPEVETLLNRVKNVQRIALPSDQQGFVKNPHNVKVEAHEVELAKILAEKGDPVTFRAVVNKNKVANPDVEMWDRIWEMKSPLGGGKNTVSHQFRKTRKQADRIIFDNRRSKFDDIDALTQVLRRFAGDPKIRHLIWVGKDLKIMQFRKS